MYGKKVTLTVEYFEWHMKIEIHMAISKNTALMLVY